MRRQVSRRQFDWLYARWCRRAGKRVSVRRRESCWVAYRGIARCAARSHSGRFRTTKHQRRLQLAADGRDRHERTVRRLCIDLAGMGLLNVSPVRKSGANQIPGKKDCLAMSLKNPSFVTPGFAQPEQQRTPPKGGSLSAAQARTATSTTLIAPPPAADDVGPPSGGQVAGDEEEPVSPLEIIEAQIRFQHTKIAMGFGAERAEVVLAELKRRRRELQATADPATLQPEPRGSDG